MRSRPARDAWVEIGLLPASRAWSARRVPQGTRGLKYPFFAFRLMLFTSRPARDAWVEMTSIALHMFSAVCRVPQGTRGLKCFVSLPSCFAARRVPQGTRGLKFRSSPRPGSWMRSRPARDAWVEILRSLFTRLAKPSRPARDAWVEISPSKVMIFRTRSRPARDAWVEIPATPTACPAPRCRVPQGTRGLK